MSKERDEFLEYLKELARSLNADTDVEGCENPKLALAARISLAIEALASDEKKSGLEFFHPGFGNDGASLEAPATDVPKVGCEDCDRPYGEPGFPDFIIPFSAWKRISTNGDDSGLLCPSCIVARLERAGISSCEGAFMSGPIKSVSETTMTNLRRVENIELAIEGRDNHWKGIREIIAPADSDLADPSTEENATVDLSAWLATLSLLSEDPGEFDGARRCPYCRCLLWEHGDVASRPLITHYRQECDLPAVAAEKLE